MITIEQIAGHWTATEAQIRTWISSGVLPMPEIIGGLVRWDEAALQTWEASGYPRSPEPSWKKMCEILQAIHREAENKNRKGA
ncbi:MAG: hypothetical protein L6306_02780 [Planctomycetales bacterium]|nr:hypothetical protein [Planctomycetales bacterium]